MKRIFNTTCLTLIILVMSVGNSTAFARNATSVLVVQKELAYMPGEYLDTIILKGDLTVASVNSNYAQLMEANSGQESAAATASTSIISQENIMFFIKVIILVIIAIFAIVSYKDYIENKEDLEVEEDTAV
jgi:hypothetical protein